MTGLDHGLSVPTVPRASRWDAVFGRLYSRVARSPQVARVIVACAWGSSLRDMYAAMDSVANAKSTDLVLDVPAGSGPILNRTPQLQAKYVGVDLSESMLGRATRARLEHAAPRGFLRSDMRRLPVADASVDRVLSFNGLHIIPDPAPAVAEFARVLKSGGTLTGSVLISDVDRATQRRHPWIRPRLGFLHLVNGAELRRVVAAEGFHDWEESRSGGLLTFRAIRS